MIFDLHNDILTAVEDRDKRNRILDEYSCKKCILAFFTTEIKRLPNVADIRKDPDLYFAIEDMDFFGPKDAQAVLELSPVYCSLTWNNSNSMAGGAFSDGVLTEKGKRTIEFLNDNGIAVDFAHLNKRSFYDAYDKAKKVLVSHTAVYSLKEHNRNIDSRQIKMIAERKGIIGLTPIRSFLCGSRVSDYARTIDCVVQSVGDKVPAIGTDFFGSSDFPQWLSNYDSFSLLYEELLRMKYSDSTIRNIFYKNAERFFAE